MSGAEGKDPALYGVDILAILLFYFHGVPGTATRVA